MIKIEHIVTPSPEQWGAVIRGMRNPMNSWGKSDSEIVDYDVCPFYFDMGEADLALMKSLSAAGSDHSKFLRMIPVYVDITAPLYWWKEFDTYKVGTVANSCSTMHKIQAKEFTIDDFSTDHLNKETRWLFDQIINYLNISRDCYNSAIKDKDSEWVKDYWWQMIQLLPSSYNQKRTVMLNYAVLKNMYHARKNHKLDEWIVFCKFIETLPHAKEVITNGEALL